MDGIRYIHTNLVARDWKALADFYIGAFGCVPVPPERHLRGPWVETLTGLKDARIDGVHLALPGFPAGGPTLEIFSYDPAFLRQAPVEVYRQGIGHLAFHVDEVQAVLDQVLVLGGSALGPVVRRQYENLGLLTVVYARDPEGNHIEIQNWKR